MNKNRRLIEMRNNYGNGISSLNVSKTYRHVRNTPFKILLNEKRRTKRRILIILDKR